MHYYNKDVPAVLSFCLGVGDCRLGRLGDPGVSPPPRQGSFVVFYLKTGLGTRPNLFGLAPLNPEVGFHMVVTGNAITNACDWSGI